MLRWIGQVLAKANHGSPLRVSTGSLDQASVDWSTAFGGEGGTQTSKPARLARIGADATMDQDGKQIKRDDQRKQSKSIISLHTYLLMWLEILLGHRSILQVLERSV